MIDFPFLNKTLVVLINLVGLWLSVLVYRQSSKQKMNKIFVLMVALMFFWVNFAYLARFFGKDQIFLAELFLRIAWFVTPLFFTFLYFLVIHLLRKEQRYQFLSKAVFFMGGSVALVTGFTNLIIEGIKFVNGDLTIIYGKGMFPFLGIIFFLICATLYPLFKGYFESSKKGKQKIEYFLVGIFVFYLANIIFNIIFPVMLGIVRFYYIGDYSAIFLLGFTAYAIVKRELFGTKIVLTSLLVALIAILLLLDALVLTEVLIFQILKLGILLIFLYFGYMLIKSVLEEIKRREETEKLSAAKSEFISIASHQLRTPLTAIKGYISMILDGNYGKLSEKTKNSLENVYKSNERLIGLVNDILNISRIETGKIEMEFKKAPLENIISSIVEELEIEAKNKNIYLKWEKSKKALPEILVDKDKIRQVILNVIDNAIKYTEKGGVTIKLKIGNGKYIIEVSDTGAGLTKYELSKMFDSFSRGMAGTRLYTEGVGLGLYIAKKFTEMHQGEIWAESPGEGKGSVFYVELPIK
ncbi:ATP-binding protein [Patescibacteria group bacterium]